jgi:hypothetical protein
MKNVAYETQFNLYLSFSGATCPKSEDANFSGNFLAEAEFC